MAEQPIIQLQEENYTEGDNKDQTVDAEDGSHKFNFYKKMGDSSYSDNVFALAQ